jgi:small GTP-binding protein
MVIKRNKLFRELFGSFLEKFPEVEAIVVSDIEGFVIAGEKKKEGKSNLEIVSVLTTLINPVLERIRNEFSFNRFGSSSFDTEDYRLLFVSIDEDRILSLVLNSMASIEMLAPYGLYIAEKSAQILTAKDDDIVQISIPNFEDETSRHEILKQTLVPSELLEKGSYSFKFVVVGDHEVGKTSLIRRFVERKFSADYRATIGLNILAHDFLLEGNEISLTLWDLGAQEFFRRYRKIYYTGAEAAFIVYDLTDRNSFEHIQNWYNELIEFIEDKNIPVVLVGNKLDLVNERVISREKGLELSRSLSLEGVSHIETSALSGENVNDAFKLIAYHYIMRLRKMEEQKVKIDLINEITETLKKLVILELSFIGESFSWSPGFQTIVNLEKLGDYSIIKDTEKEQLYAYKNGLIVNNFLYDSFNLANTDGAFLTFNARNKIHIDPMWKEILIETIRKIRKKRVIIVGLRITESSDWSQLMEEFKIEEDLEEKLVTILFLKIGPDFREKTYELLKLMLNAIVNTRNLK